ncbi:stage V sporulation protein AA [Massilibacterium senegalense]|uniref:stage V sporulation protein AA n=1 Tax=Massilibacterium senegalense TaxID=1632858 RepID=UPI000780DA40|nr:stage V sporulation protein AA [Massilibacterium senegalense]
MDTKQRLYLHYVNRIQVEAEEIITLGKVATLYMKDEQKKQLLRQLPIKKVNKDDGRFSIISTLSVMERIHQWDATIEVISYGETEIVIEQKDKKKLLKPFWIFLIWWLLFIGSGLAIMNFHEDVSMKAVHEKLYYILTGERTNQLYWLQVPYSIGIAVGMVLFFNHIFKKRFNDEPSPLEVEMFNYQEDLDRYVKTTEQKYGEKR